MKGLVIPENAVPVVEPEKKVASVELFFDLVFLYTVTRASELLQEDHSTAGLLRALVGFVPAYWLWVGTTMHANLHDPDTPRDRLGIFGVGACGLVMAVTLPQAYHDGGLLLGGAYWLARLFLLALVTGRPHRRAYATFSVGAFLTGPLLLAGGLAHGDTRWALWALAALTDLAVPLLARRRLAGVPFDPGHLVERFGAFILIALGETIVATAAGAEHLDKSHLLTLLAAFAVVCALWWVYFTFGPDAIRSALLKTDTRIEIIRPVLSYGHLALIAGIVAMAAALGRAVAEPTEALSDDAAGLLLGGAITYLATFAFTRWRLFHSVAIPRLAAAAALSLLWAFHPYLSALAILTAIAAVLIILNAAELRLLPRTLSAE